MTQLPETFCDQLLDFTLPARHVRGRMVRLDGVVEHILSAHDYPAPIAHMLGEALVLTALMGGLLKDEAAQMTMQAQTEAGAVRLLVCDYRRGELRGYEIERASCGERVCRYVEISVVGVPVKNTKSK